MRKLLRLREMSPYHGNEDAAGAMVWCSGSTLSKWDERRFDWGYSRQRRNFGALVSSVGWLLGLNAISEYREYMRMNRKERENKREKERVLKKGYSLIAHTHKYIRAKGSLTTTCIAIKGYKWIDGHTFSSGFWCSGSPQVGDALNRARSGQSTSTLEISEIYSLCLAR